MGIGAFQSSNGIVIHFFFAFLIFIGQSTYILIHTWYIDPRLAKVDPQYKQWVSRRVVSTTGPVCLLLMIIFKTMQLDLLSSVSEIFLIVGFLLWILSLYGSFGDAGFDITMKSGALNQRVINDYKSRKEDGLSLQGDKGRSEVSVNIF